MSESESERWLYSSGPMPENVRQFLNALNGTGEPFTSEPFTGEPFTGEPSMGEPFTGEPFMGEPSMGEPFMGEPFTGEPPTGQPPVATRAPSAPGQGERSVVEVGATVRSPTLIDRPPVTPPAVPLSHWLQILPRPAQPDVRAIEALKTTAELNIPPEVQALMGRLPFRAPPPEELTRTMKVHEHNWRQGKTEPLEDNFIAKMAGALPFARNTGGAAVVPFPPLTLEEYALLQAEISVSPERKLEILSRYKVVDDAARQAMDEHWQAELAASPGARARFEEAVADYTASLRS